ncbi:uncharacterized protein LOC119403122 [Rhipicephalus sanguineus]|uniref:uncharacterized protein LOC119403122 n=1 Tax=Rhipicephalus sanguineus TaxID=34632 RepID=UPI001892D733|nr:uncharacterized protein LOC119403122 [Rhipicephalus sanguineus]
MNVVSPRRFLKTSGFQPLSSTALLVVVFVTTFSVGTDVVQRPEVTPCMTGKRGFRLSDFTIQDSKVGRYMRVNYTVDVLRQGDRSPAVKFTVHNSLGLRTPCVDDFGSCTYKACGGTKLTERMIGAGWNNSCENIPLGTYQSSILLKVIPAVRLVMGNGTFNIRVEGITDKGQVECVSFYIFIED